MTTKIQAITAVIARLLGARGTKEEPPGSNHNFITVWYNNNVAKIGDGAWCEMTATWAMWTGGAKILKKGRAYTVYAAGDAQRGENGSSWQWGTKGMRRGDQVYYDWSGKKGSISVIDHTGIVEKIVGNGTFYVLEGNTGDGELMRVLRDGKYVVGYTRFAWDRLVTDEPAPTPPKPDPSPKPTPSPAFVKKLQKLLEVDVDGQWGKFTDVRAQRMRTAARCKAGYPKNIRKPFSVINVQLIIDTPADGIWGPKSQAKLVAWIKDFQRIAGLTVDGQWGPKTDNAYVAARKRNLNNF